MNESYIGLTIQNRTIIGYYGSKLMGSGKTRDYYVYRCDLCLAEAHDIFGNIKHNAKGACKVCSELGGNGARKNFVGMTFNGRTLLKLVSFNDDSQNSVYLVKCLRGHKAEVTLATVRRRHCDACARAGNPLVKLPPTRAQLVGMLSALRSALKYSLSLHSKKPPQFETEIEPLLAATAGFPLEAGDMLTSAGGGKHLDMSWVSQAQEDDRAHKKD